MPISEFKTNISLALSLLCLSLATSCGPDCVKDPPIDGPPERVDLEIGDPLPFLSTAEGVEVLEVLTAGDFVLYCNGIGGLLIQDKSNTSRLGEVARLNSPLSHPRFPRCQHVAATLNGGSLDTVAFSNKGDELQPIPFVSLFDMQNGPSQIDVFTDADASVPASFEGIALKGDVLYIAAHEAGVFVVERSGSELIERARIDAFEDAFGLHVAGDRLFVADGIGGLKVLDIENPLAPILEGGIDLEGASLAVTVDDERNLAYLSAGSVGVHVVDVSGTPSYLTTLDTPGSALQVALIDERVIIADWNDVRLFDMSIPDLPFSLGKERPQTRRSAFPRVLGIASDDDSLYVGEWTALFVYENNAGVSAPDLDVTSREIVFESTAAGETSATGIVVENIGSFSLSINDVLVDAPFDVRPKTLELAPGERGLLEVLFTPETEDLSSTEVQICSNDLDEPKRSLALFGNPQGIRLGDEAPNTQIDILGQGLVDITDFEGEVVLLAYFATF